MFLITDIITLIDIFFKWGQMRWLLDKQANLLACCVRFTDSGCSCMVGNLRFACILPEEGVNHSGIINNKSLKTPCFKGFFPLTRCVCCALMVSSKQQVPRFKQFYRRM